ncbi:GTP-binding protein Rhes isoform X2 [Diorhabda sublineata]|uniref:GTP-binding protein Rhes isoform X2 n=1 Tax=Diorhabda sublineata TaxID=1163346 RepID=UPI0024E051B0|nr:GTP-binding protein Rhes isoform X2 [Diorhabda sublineata]
MDLSACTNWLCTKRQQNGVQTTPQDYQSVVTSGPGPSPVSSTSCDDVVPPSKNCFRLVMLGDLFVIVFSMDSRETFEEAIRLREQILETKLNAGASSTGVGLTRKKTMPRVPMVLAGNKCDKEMRTVTVEEAQAFCDSQDSNCAFVETSAKKNFKVDEVFYQLFLVANLPLEMAPNHHKRVSASFGSPCPLPPSAPSHHSKKYHLSVKRRLSDACGVVTPNVRRPSIRTDLMIMRTKTCSLGDNPGTSNNSPIRWRKVDNGCSLQ